MMPKGSDESSESEEEEEVLDYDGTLTKYLSKQFDLRGGQTFVPNNKSMTIYHRKTLDLAFAPARNASKKATMGASNASGFYKEREIREESEEDEKLEDV